MVFCWKMDMRTLQIKLLVKNKVSKKYIASGAFGCVYLLSNQQYAIKYIDYKRLSKNQLQIAYQLPSTFDHKNIVKIYGIFFDSSFAAILMEQLSNHIPLSSCNYLKFGTKKFCILMFQLLEALQYLSSFNLVHCDIKPQNIMIARNFNLKLVDFDFCTTSGTIDCRGSFDYMAPEVFSQQLLTTKADVYSAGCVGIYLITGYNPWYPKSCNMAYKYQTVVLNKTPKVVECFNLKIQKLLSGMLEFNYQNRLTAKEASIFLKKNFFYFQQKQKKLIGQKVFLLLFFFTNKISV